MSGDKSANTIYRAQVKDAYIDMNRVLLNAKNSGSEDEQKIVEIK